MNGLDPDQMTPEERLSEIGVILARYGRSFELMDENGQIVTMNQAATPTTVYAADQASSSYNGEYD